jgi:hypothetical protein
MFCVFLLDSISHLEEEKEFFKEIMLVSTEQFCLRGEVSNEILWVYSVSEFDAGKL